MKRFARTTAGKLLIFISLLLVLSILIGAVLGIAVLASVNAYSEKRSTALGSFCYSAMDKEAWVLGEYVLGYRQDLDIEAYARENTNLRYCITDSSGSTVLSNESEAQINNMEIRRNWFMVWASDGHGNDYYDMFYGEIPDESWIPYAAGTITEREIFSIAIAVDPELPVDDSYRSTVLLAQLGYQLRYVLIGIAACCLLLAIVLFIVLMRVSGRRPDSEEPVPGALNRVPADVMAVIGIAAAGILAAFMDSALNGSAEITMILLVCVPCTLGILAIFLALCMDAAARVRQHSLFRNTLIGWVCLLVWRVCKWLGTHCLSVLRGICSGLRALLAGIPLVWRTALLLAAVSLLELLVILTGRNGVIALCWLLEKLITVPLLLWLAIVLRRLQKGGEELAAGNLDVKLPLNGLFWEFRRHAENLNSIGAGMTKAVDQRMKSERMKTELITNVSHDLKTPLTSIINYSDLIEREPTENAKITEYAAVLHRQSERMKRLIEDLVEASRAASGAIELFPEPCDAEVLVSQAVGEYEQRLSAAELTPVVRLPEKPLRIMADGRRIWRVFDNLMNNMCKYAQRGTRVWVTLEEQNGEAVFIFRNISGAELNLTAEELMERFTRGDASRNTEGSGLGLSIAKSLTELQGGTMELGIDGDLFKVTLRFPVL